MHYQLRFGTELFHAAGPPLHKQLPTRPAAALPFFPWHCSEGGC